MRWGSGLFELGEEMAYGGDRMIENHARTDITHHFLYFVPVVRRVAVYRAFAATGFEVAFGAMRQPMKRVVQQFLTLRAHGVSDSSVLTVTIYGNHLTDN